MSGKCLWNRDTFPSTLALKVADFGGSLNSIGSSLLPIQFSGQSERVLLTPLGVFLFEAMAAIPVSAGFLAPAVHTSETSERQWGLEYLWKASCMNCFQVCTALLEGPSFILS